MCSITALMDVVERKNEYIKNALKYQAEYQVQLDENIKETKHEIQVSFENLLSSMEYRKQQMNDAVEAMYILKKLASMNRIGRLKALAGDINECLDMHYYNSYENETMQRDMIKNVFHKIDNHNLEYSNDALLTWSSDEYQLKEMIKNYGAVDLKDSDEEDEREKSLEFVPQSQSSEINDKNSTKRDDESLIKENQLQDANNNSEIAKVEEIKTSSKVESWLKECSGPEQSNQNTTCNCKKHFQQYESPQLNWSRESSIKNEESSIPSLCNEDVSLDNHTTPKNQSNAENEWSAPFERKISQSSTDITCSNNSLLSSSSLSF